MGFCQIWDWWWNINNNTSFYFRSFPGKTNKKIFQRIQKNPILLFAQIWAKINSPEKRSLLVFKYSSYLPLGKKSEKTKDPFLRKMPDWRTDRQTDRWGSNYFWTLKKPFTVNSKPLFQNSKQKGKEKKRTKWRETAHVFMALLLPWIFLKS